MQWEWGCECCFFQFVYQTFCEVWMMFLLKNQPFYVQFGHKYDRACIWDGIIYHFINFGKVWTLESDSFNHEILAGETVLGVQGHSQYFMLVSFYPLAILGQWGIVVSSGICSSVYASVCLSIQFLLAYIHYWHQTITAYLPCPVLVPSTPTFDLGTVTFTLTLLVNTKLPERNITSMPKWYICCILSISQKSSKGSDLGWPLTHFSRSDRSLRPLTLLVSAILPQQNITSMPKQYIWWVLPISWMSSDRWPTFQGQCDLSVDPISPSLQTWLTSNHHCIFTMPSTCTSYYYFLSQTFDLGMVTLTLTLLVTAKLPEPNITLIPKRYICCILPISQMSWKGSNLGGPLTTFQGQICHCKICYNTIRIKHHIHAKTVHLVNLANILYKF